MRYAGNGRSVQEADKAARGGHSWLWSKAGELPKVWNKLYRVVTARAGHEMSGGRKSQTSLVGSQ